MNQTSEAYFCRLCVELQSENHLININSQKSINLDLAYKILHCFLIDMTKNDYLPKHICIICCGKVISSYEFHEQVQRAQEIFEKKIFDETEVNNTVCTKEEIDIDDEEIIDETEVNNIVCTKEEIDTDDDFKIKIEQPTDDNQRQDDDDEKPLIQRKYERQKESSKVRKSKRIAKRRAHLLFEQKKKIKFDEECDKIFTKPEHVTQECPSTIEPEDKFICYKCGRIFKRKLTLEQHLPVHFDIRKFKCTACPRTFKLKTSLKRHARIHTNQFPYECEHCKKCFRQKTYLRIHLRQHTGEKPYSCTQCNKYFTNDSNFIKHIRGLHRLTNFSIANRRQFPFVN